MVQKIKLMVYGAFWCEDTLRIGQFLKGLNVLYYAKAIDNNLSAEREARKISNQTEGEIEIPVVALPNKEVLINPGRKTLLGKLKELQIIEE